MTYYDAALNNGAILRLEVLLVSQNIPANTSQISWALYLLRGNNTASWTNTGVGWSVNIAGITGNGSYTFDFRSQTQVTIASNGSLTIYHNADGTASLPVSGHTNDTGTVVGGPMDTAGTFVLPTIPRASTSTFTSAPLTAGVPVTINTNRASSSFTHTITYEFGSATGTIGTGIQAALSWTPPMSMLTAIPNLTSASGSITTTTYSGSTVIGSTVTRFTLNAPASVVPTFTSISCGEANSIVSAAGIGGYVQTLSKLSLSIVGAAGAYGSTITAYKITVDNQVINAVSGITGPIASSGTLTITATITDSRGRTATQTLSITVLAYTPPAITAGSVAVKRAYTDGTIHDDGTFVNVAFAAAVSSLIVATVQKNTITYRLSYRLHGTTTWTVANTTTPAGISFSGNQTISGPPFDIAKSYDILLEIIDKFSTTAVQSTVTTAAIFMHWDGSAGLGLGKYREKGMLDVAGDIYANGKLLSGFQLDYPSVVPTMIWSDFPMGTSSTLVQPDPAWPMTGLYGTLVTVRSYSGGGGTIQYWSSYQTTTDIIFFRQWFYGATAWTQWQAVTSPAGQITQYAGSTAPPGYLLCDGTAVSRTTYARLFTICSTTYGTGDGSTTFNLPNLKGRVAVGFDSTQTEFNGVGKTGGEKTHLLTATEMPSHTHGERFSLNAASGTAMGGLTTSGGAAYQNAEQPTQAAGGGAAHNNLQPYISVNHIIKY